MREATVRRTTRETDVEVRLALDGTGKSDIDTGIGFLDHMLCLFALHGRFDLNVRCKGDTDVDGHHSAEDIGIVMGQAFLKALGDKVGIERYASLHLAMDEALVLTACDISGRGRLYADLPFPVEKIGTFDTQLAEVFWDAFCANAGLTLHLRMITGVNAHHIAEAAFKGAARVLRAAVRVTGASLPSTKGAL